jgi:hypothetical protein
VKLILLGLAEIFKCSLEMILHHPPSPLLHQIPNHPTRAILHLAHRIDEIEDDILLKGKFGIGLVAGLFRMKHWDQQCFKTMQIQSSKNGFYSSENKIYRNHFGAFLYIPKKK